MCGRAAEKAAVFGAAPRKLRYTGRPCGRRQVVRPQLPKLVSAGSNPVARSKNPKARASGPFPLTHRRRDSNPGGCGAAGTARAVPQRSTQGGPQALRSGGGPRRARDAESRRPLQESEGPRERAFSVDASAFPKLRKFMNFRQFHGVLPRMKRKFMNFRATARLRHRNGGMAPRRDSRSETPAAKPIKKAAGYAQHPDGLESISPRGLRAPTNAG